MSEWKKYKIYTLIESQVLIIGDGYRAKNSELSIDKGLPFARAGNINDGFKLENTECLAPENLHKAGEKISQVGDVLFTSKGTVGRVAFVTNMIPEFVYSPQLTWWRILDTKQIHPEFLYCWMRGLEFISQINSFSGQTDMAAYVSLTDQRRMMYMTLPNIEEQKEITAAISCLDRKISNLRQQNETLESIAQTLFKHWFVDFEFPNEDGKPYKSSGGAMVRSDLGDIPVGWNVEKLGEIYKTTSGGTPSRKESEYYAETGIRWVKSKELYSTFVLDTEEKITPLGLKNSSAKLLPARTVLIAMYGATVGQVSILGIDSTCNQAICAVIEQQYSAYFIYLWLKHTEKEWTGMAIGSAQQNLSQILISKINILISSVNLNNKFNAVISPLFQKILINSTQVQTLTKTRDRLLPKLMSGQLRIPE